MNNPQSLWRRDWTTGKAHAAKYHAPDFIMLLCGQSLERATAKKTPYELPADEDRCIDCEHSIRAERSKEGDR